MSGTPDILQRIVAVKHEEVAAAAWPARWRTCAARPRPGATPAVLPPRCAPRSPPARRR
jgi:hypothetical protein